MDIKEKALREIGLDLPHGEWLLNAVLRALGKPECKGAFVPKKNSFSNRWKCECGKSLSDCPKREALK